MYSLTNMFNLISLGMTKESISAEALQALKKSDKIYLETYTVDFPYSIQELENTINNLNSKSQKIIPLKRENVESEEILKNAKQENISLLIYGDCLSATTHTQLILACKNQNIKYKIFHNASILTTISNTGLSLYKFGKTTSMPSWAKNYKPTSFIKYIKDNQKIKAHSLILTDIGLELKSSIEQLKESTKKENYQLPKKIIIISNVGTQNEKIFYNTISNLKEKEISKPFCIIIPSDLSEHEKEFLEKIQKT